MTSYNPVMMVSPKEFKSLVEYYKGNITESTLLNEAARVAAEARVLMDDTKIEPALKEPQLKQLMRKRTKLSKELRQSAGDVTVTPTVDDDSNKDSLQERVLKGVANKINAKTTSVGENLKNMIQQQTPAAASTPKTGTKRKISPIMKKQIHFTPKKSSPKGKGKKRKTEVEKLQETEGSWEPWEKRGWDPVDGDDEYDNEVAKGGDDDDEGSATEYDSTIEDQSDDDSS